VDGLPPIPGQAYEVAQTACLAAPWPQRRVIVARLRDIEELLFERGVTVTYETIRCWCCKFGAGCARRAKAVRRRPGSTWHLGEMFVTPSGEHYQRRCAAVAVCFNGGMLAG